MADVSVRPARAGDADEIARIQVLAWRTGYERLVPREVLAALDAAAIAAEWRRAVTEPPTARHRVMVALEGDWTVGFSAFGPADPDEERVEPDTAAIQTLLVEPRWARRGHGSRLLNAAADLLREDGAQMVLVWVPEDDTRTRGFYESAGWEPDGAVRSLDVGGKLVREVRLHAALDGEASDGAAG
jgi:GNAT superfamily N-acetyltransferase